MKLTRVAIKSNDIAPTQFVIVDNSEIETLNYTYNMTRWESVVCIGCSKLKNFNCDCITKKETDCCLLEF